MNVWENVHGTASATRARMQQVFPLLFQVPSNFITQWERDKCFLFHV